MGKVLGFPVQGGDNEYPDLQQFPEVCKIFEKLCEAFDKVLIIFDPNHEAVQIPPGTPTLDNGDVALQFGYWIQAPNFEFDDEGVSSDLLFNGVGKFCFVPWEAAKVIKAGDYIVVVDESLLT